MRLRLLKLASMVLAVASGCEDKKDSSDTTAEPDYSTSYTTYADYSGTYTDYDNDGDGYAVEDGDCDDANSAINPGATEICDDQIDNDCNELTDSEDPACKE